MTRILSYFIICALVLPMSGCRSKKSRLVPAPAPRQVTSAAPIQLAKNNWTDLPGWAADDLTGAFTAYKTSFAKLKDAKWQHLKSLADRIDPNDNAAIRNFFQTQYDPYQMITNRGESHGLITGYYEPLLQGSRQQSDQYPYPIYDKPKDLVNVNLSEVYPDSKDWRMRGRLKDGTVVPFYSRDEIDGPSKPLAGTEIFWVSSKVDRFFLNVQGSGRIQLDSGEIVKVGYNNQNGYPYTSIGKHLVDSGAIPAEEISMQSIKTWFNNNPDKVDNIISLNQRYTFFREVTEEESGPRGSLNVPLTAERSVAVDRNYIELGTPVFLSTRYPDTGEDFNKLMMAQDTGGAIKGKIRADVFWGFGPTAELRAGIMKEKGQLWVFLPKGELPLEFKNRQ